MTGSTADVVSLINFGLVSEITLTTPNRPTIINPKAILDQVNGSYVTNEDAYDLVNHDENSADQWCYVAPTISPTGGTTSCDIVHGNISDTYDDRTGTTCGFKTNQTCLTEWTLANPVDITHINFHSNNYAAANENKINKIWGRVGGVWVEIISTTRYLINGAWSNIPFNCDSCTGVRISQTHGLLNTPYINEITVTGLEVIPSCIDWVNQTDCQNHGCIWWNGSCHDDWADDCAEVNNEIDCSRHACYWYNGACYNSPQTCDVYKDKAGCEASPLGCYWWSDGTCRGYEEILLIAKITNVEYPGNWYEPGAISINATVKNIGNTAGYLYARVLDCDFVGPPAPNAGWVRTSKQLAVGESETIPLTYDLPGYNGPESDFNFRVQAGISNTSGYYDDETDCYNVPYEETFECRTYDNDEVACLSHSADGCYWWSDGTCRSYEEPEEPTNCSIYTNQTDCETADCHWYAYPNPFGAPSCHSKDMIMAYLPFIIAGVGGIILIAALASRSKPVYYYHPPPQYYPPLHGDK